jgi:hypothetical protein
MNLTVARRKPRSLFGREVAYTASLPTLIGGFVGFLPQQFNLSYGLVHGLDSRINRGCILCRKLVLARLTSAQSFGTTRKLRFASGYAPLVPVASAPETGRDAAYSSLRRKKIHTLSPEARSVKPRRDGTSVACGAILGATLLEVRSKHDSVVCLDPTSTP